MNTLKSAARRMALLCCFFLLAGVAGCSQLEMLRLYFANEGTQVRFDQPLPVRLPFREHDGWVVVQARVNGSPPIEFVIDTGASMLAILTSDRTDPLGLDMSGLRKIGGEGVAAITAAVQDDMDIDFGGVALLDQTVLAIPLASVLCDEGIRTPPFQGVIGHELFDRFVVEVDHARGEVVLHDPDTYQYTGSGHVVPVEISGRQPFTRARVRDGEGQTVDARLHVDSGAGIDLTLFPQAHEGIRVPPGGEETVACFVGGLARYRTGQPVTLGLENTPEAEVPVRYSIGEEVIDSGQHGRLGARFLSRYNVIYDYRRARMILSPRSAPSMPAP